MLQLRLNADQGEAIILSFDKKTLTLQFELPESALMKGLKRDGVQYCASRNFNIEFPDQLIIYKFLDTALVVHNSLQKAEPMPSPNTPVAINIETLVENIPPQALRDVCEQIKDRIEKLENK